jgi:hypothetical protein
MSRQNVGFLLRALLIILVGAAPVISVVIASGFASTLGCKLDEGNPHPCPFHGVDLGDTLYSMFVAGWLGLITVPLGAIGLAILLVAWIIVTTMRWQNDLDRIW